MGMMDAPAAEPQTKPKQPAQPTGGMMADPNAGQTPAPAVTQQTGQQTGGMMGGSSQQTDGGQQTGGGQTQQPPSPVQPGDWSSVYWNEALMKSLPGLRTQAEAARQRLGPLAAGSADAAGAIGSPSSALLPIPYVGPFLAGAVHEGIKSYNSQPNWIPDKQGATQIAEDTAGGAATGLLGQGTALAARAYLPQLVKGGIVTGGGMLAHKLLGGSFLGDVGKEIAPMMGVYSTLDDVGKWAASKSGDVLASPAAQQAMKALTLGIGSAARTGNGSYDQWIPGQ